MENQPDNKEILTEAVIDAIARVLVLIAKDLAKDMADKTKSTINKLKIAKK